MLRHDWTRPGRNWELKLHPVQNWGVRPLLCLYQAALVIFGPSLTTSVKWVAAAGDAAQLTVPAVVRIRKPYVSSESENIIR